MRLTLAAILAVVLVGGCAAKRAAAPEVASAGQAEAASQRSPAAWSAKDSRKLIRTVDLELRVHDTDEVADRVEDLTAASGGYISGVDAYLRQGLRHFRITIKVPASSLEEVLGELRALAAEVQREHLRTEDVTEQYIDLEARIRTLQATEVELHTLLTESRSRGHKAEDIMAVYRHLTEIRTNIEQSQAKLSALVNLTTYSTIKVELVPTEAARPLVSDKWRPSETVRGGVRSLVNALKLLADFAIYFVIVVLPVGLLVAIPLWLVVKGLRSIRRRRSEQSSVAEDAG